MKKSSHRYSEYLTILKDELVPAEGCTEPISVAYAAAKCRETLGEEVKNCKMRVSGPIIKNVKSVVVPHTNGQKGLKVAVSAGIVGGNADALLEVLSGIDERGAERISSYQQQHEIDISPAENDIPFYIDITEYGSSHSARVVIKDAHTNIVLIARDDKTVFEADASLKGVQEIDKNVLSVANILDFALTVDVDDITDIVGRMEKYNTAISEEGLKGTWGVSMGKTLLESFGNDINTRARAAAAAGSDARMSGCEKPVIIVSGSGNQGMTASLPVIEFARELKSTKETLYRALVLSSLVTVHIKSDIGPISAFCGAVCAGVGAGCGIAFLKGADETTINHTIVNALAICSGMICDGAKPSCAAKISMAVEAGIIGYEMYVREKQFINGEGIVKSNVERTIAAVGDVAHNGMHDTDNRILKIMLED